MLQESKGHRIAIEDYIANHAHDIKGNLHWQAWEEADAAVLRMRKSAK